MKTPRAYFSLSGCASLVFTTMSVCAEPAGTVLFAQEGAQIVSPSGVQRAARQGEVLQSGERLTTSAGAISQIKLADGSLVGVRPGSELKLDTPSSATASGQSMSLLQGRVRIIGAELMDPKRSSALTLQAGPATLQLHGADVESMVVKAAPNSALPGAMTRGNPPPDATRPAPGGAPEGMGSYNRLVTGSGNLRSGSIVEPLAPRQVSFVGSGSPVPVAMAAMPNPTQGDAPKGPPPGEAPKGPPPGGGGPAVAGAKPLGPPPGGPGAQGGMLTMSQTTSTLTAPRPGSQGLAMGAPIPGGPPSALPPPNPPGMQGPNISGMGPGGPGGMQGPNMGGMGPGGPGGLPGPSMGGVGPGGPGGFPGPNMGGIGPGGPGGLPQTPPVLLKPPVICTPNPTAGKPPICK